MFFSLFRGLGRSPRENFIIKSEKSKTELPAVVGKAYDFSVWLIQKVEGLPRSYRLTVGDRLVTGVLDLLLRLVDAAYARDKAAILDEVNGMLNRMRYLMRVAKDLKLFTVQS